MSEPTEWLSNAGAFLAFLQGGRDTEGVKPLERDVFRIAIPLYLFVLSVIPAQTRNFDERWRFVRQSFCFVAPSSLAIS